jgi:calnexin
MRFDAFLASALYSSALLAGHVRAEDAEDASSASIAESSTSTSMVKPTFTVSPAALLREGRHFHDHTRRTLSFPSNTMFQPTNLKAPFLEQFTDDWESRWKASHAKKEDSKTEEDWAYVGEWAVEEPHVLKAIEGDKGLVVKNAAAHHAISAKFDKKIDNKGKTLVVQYEVKLQSEHVISISPRRHA